MTKTFNLQRFIDCANELRQLDEPELPNGEAFERSVSLLYKRIRKRNRRANGSQRKQNDLDNVKAIASRRAAQLNSVELQNEQLPVELQHATKTCYSCNKPYRAIHPNYHLLCVECGNVSEGKRSVSADLTGYRAIVTGGRIKIGFQTALRLLECGAQVHITTRFPHEAAVRFSEDANFQTWKGRLIIHGVDFRNVTGVLSFIERFRQQHSSLEILINNAAQSVKRSQRWHQRLTQFEANAENAALLSHDQQSLIAPTEPENHLVSTNGNPEFSKLLIDATIESDAKEQEVFQIDTSPELLTSLAALRDDDDRLDTREKTTWNTRLGEVEPVEILEAMLVNSNAPALLAQGFIPAFKASTKPNKFVNNVVGADSMFQLGKSGYHPHVNMSKAALNMMTHTCADSFANDNILMNSIDTGWITYEGSAKYREQRSADGFQPPYDHLDGAVRILDPIMAVVNKCREPEWGKLYRNFKPTGW